MTRRTSRAIAPSTCLIVLTFCFIGHCSAMDNGPQTVDYREWRSHRNTSKVARLVKCGVDGAVELEDQQGNRISLKLAQLDFDNQLLIKRCIAMASGRGVRSIGVEPLAPVVQRAPKRWFLGIGVDAYNHDLIRDLRFCGRDAIAFGKAFKNLSYDVTVLTAPDDAPGIIKKATVKKDIQRALDDLLGVIDQQGKVVFPGRVGPKDTVVLSFSGHGVFIDGEGFFCPADADLTIESSRATLVSVSDVYGQLAASPAALKVMFVDACRNNLGGRAVGQNDKQIDNLARVLSQKRQGIATFSSCSVGQKSLEDENLKHGVFSHFLIRGLMGAASTSMVSGDSSVNQVRLMQLCAYAARKAEFHAKSRHRNHAQKPTLTAEEIKDQSLGDLQELWIPSELPPLVDGPVATYKLDLSKVEDGRLPPGWKTTEAVGVARKQFGPTIEALASGKQSVTSPTLEIKGDFCLEFEIIPRDGGPKFDMALLGDEDTQDFAIGFDSWLGGGGGGWSIKLDQLNPNVVKDAAMFVHAPIPCTFRIERKAGVLYLYCNSNPSTKVVLTGQKSPAFRAVRFDFLKENFGISKLRLAPIRPIALADRGVTSPTKLRRFSPEDGWKVAMPPQNKHCRVDSPPLKIGGDFSMDLVFAVDPKVAEYNFGLTLLGKDGNHSFPVWIHGWLGHQVDSFMPGQGKCKVIPSPQSPIRLTLNRVGRRSSLLINGQVVGQCDSGLFADFDAIRLDGKNCADVTIRELSIRPAEAKRDP